jgi:autotransporter-associated beta strand protein
LTLNGVNTYTGETIIKQGTIALGAGGSIATSSKITVGDTIANNAAVFNVSLVSGGFHAVTGQTVAGFGTVVSGVSGSATIDSGAYIASGNSNVGTLSFSGTNTTAALKIQGTYLWDLGALKDNTSGIAGTDFDQIKLTGLAGNLALSGNVTLSFVNGIADPNSANAFWTTNHTWTIIAGTNSNTNTGSTQFSGVTNAAWTHGNFTTLADASGNDLLTYTAVPEPATWALLAFSLTTVVALRRRA